MFINLLLSVFGFVVVTRTLMICADEFALTKQNTTMIVLFTFLLIVISIFLFQDHRFFFWIFIGIIWISLNIFPYFFRKKLIQKLKIRSISLLDEVILGLQVGKSFRTSLEQAVQNQNSWYRIQFLEIYSAVVASERPSKTTKTAFLNILIEEFRNIDQSQTKIVEQVRALRRQIKIEDDFRRRSGQVTQQIRIQAVVISFLYLALLSFVVMQFGFFQNQMLIMASSLLFIAGLAWIFLVGRGMKWKT